MPQVLFERAATYNKWDIKKGDSPLANFARMVYPQVSNQTLQYINAHCFHYKIRKGAHLLKEGDNCEYLFLIIKGAFRSYIKEGGNELNTWISFENEMITSIRALYGIQPSIENIQALEDAELIGATYNDLHYLYDHSPDMNIVGRKLLERYYEDADERAYIVKMGNATTKYNYFLKTKGDVIDRIPHKYIASYLNMAMETFSRIHTSSAGKGLHEL